ncbi:unnamed protein product [Urochloa humidicola]
MEAQPGSASFHIDRLAGFNEARAARKRKSDRQHLLVSILRDICIVVFGILLPMHFLLYDMPPEFSVQLPAIKGLDTPPLLAVTPGGPASISPAFNVTLHASNRRATRRCYHNGEALVSYAGFTLATGRVPGFCVPGKGAREIGFTASADGVVLQEDVLDRMAQERRVGTARLHVEVRLFRRDDGSDRPTWIWCGLWMDATTQPPNVAPCTVLG